MYIEVGLYMGKRSWQTWLMQSTMLDDKPANFAHKLCISVNASKS